MAIGTPAIAGTGGGGGGSVTQGTSPWVDNITQIGGATLTIGQQLASASIPVILPSATITTLTPPSNSGYALDSSLSTIDTDLKSNITLHAGTNVIGHVIADNGSTTAVTGNVAVTSAAQDASYISQEATTLGIKGLTAFGAVTTNAPTYTTAKSDALSLDTSGLLRVSLKDTPANTNKLLVTPDSVALPANQSVNVSQINAVTPLMGNGITGTGSQRVTIASDNTAFSVNATLSAETTKVIGTVNQGTSPWAVSLAAETTKAIGVTRTSDGAGNLLTSNSTTTTSKFGLDTNILSILGTAPTTAGKLDVKGADGDVFVRQATASNLKAQVVAGDATGAAVPATAIYNGGIAKTALPAAATDGNLTGAMMDKFGRLVVVPGGLRDLVTDNEVVVSNGTETTILALVASTFLDVSSIKVTNTSATPCYVQFRDTTGGTVRHTMYCPANDMRGQVWNIPMTQTTAGTNWTAQASASVSSLYIYMQAIKNK